MRKTKGSSFSVISSFSDMFTSFPNIHVRLWGQYYIQNPEFTEFGYFVISELKMIQNNLLFSK